MEFTSARRDRSAPSAALSVRIGPVLGVKTVANEKRTKWLTERYCLYTTDRTTRLYRAEIHHVPWKVRPGHAVIAENSMLTAIGLPPPTSDPIIHLADPIEALVWRPEELS